MGHEEGREESTFFFSGSGANRSVEDLGSRLPPVAEHLTLVLFSRLGAC